MKVIKKSLGPDINYNELPINKRIQIDQKITAKKARMRLRRRGTDALQAAAKRQAKMMVIKRTLGPDINYKELPMQKRIQIDQKVVAKKRAVIDKISKKILRKLKAGEGERVKQAKLAKAES